MSNPKWEIVVCELSNRAEFPFNFLAPGTLQEDRLTSIYWDKEVCTTIGGDYMTVPLFDMTEEEIKSVKEKLEKAAEGKLIKHKYANKISSNFVEVKRGSQTGLVILI